MLLELYLFKDLNFLLIFLLENGVDQNFIDQLVVVVMFKIGFGKKKIVDLNDIIEKDCVERQ